MLVGIRWLVCVRLHFFFVRSCSLRPILFTINIMLTIDIDFWCSIEETLASASSYRWCVSTLLFQLQDLEMDFLVFPCARGTLSMICGQLSKTETCAHRTKRDLWNLSIYKIQLLLFSFRHKKCVSFPKRFHFFFVLSSRLEAPSSITWYFAN